MSCQVAIFRLFCHVCLHKDNHPDDHLVFFFFIYPRNKPFVIKAPRQFTIPAAYFLESLHNAVKVRSFFRFVIPAIYHQLYVLWLHFHRRDVGSEWWIFVRHDTVNYHCLRDKVEMQHRRELKGAVALGNVYLVFQYCDEPLIAAPPSQRYKSSLFCPISR